MKCSCRLSNMGWNKLWDYFNPACLYNLVDLTMLLHRYFRQMKGESILSLIHTCWPVPVDWRYSSWEVVLEVYTAYSVLLLDIECLVFSLPPISSFDKLLDYLNISWTTFVFILDIFFFTKSFLMEYISVDRTLLVWVSTQKLKLSISV
jgi:hypothetical protein